MALNRFVSKCQPNRRPGIAWVLGATFIGLSVFCDHASAQSGIPPLRGVSKVTVGVAINPTAGMDGLGVSEDRLRTLVELRLRTAGLRVLSLDESRADKDVIPIVQLNILWIPAETETARLGYSFSTRLTVEMGALVRLNGSVSLIFLYGQEFLDSSNAAGISNAIETVVERRIRGLRSTT